MAPPWARRFSEKPNPPELPLGGDRLPDTVRPRTRCERGDFSCRALFKGWDRCHLWQPGYLAYSSRPLGFAPRRRRRFALDRAVLPRDSSKKGAPIVSHVTSAP